MVTGQKSEVLQSVVVKKGTKTEACAITGLGLETVQVANSCVSSCGNFHPKQTLLKDEVFRFKTGSGIQCFAKFERDLTTGEVISFSADPRSDPACDFLENDVAALQLLLNGIAIGASTSDPDGKGQTGDGFLSTGSDSCTTRIVNGKVYTWGSPCPQWARRVGAPCSFLPGRPEFPAAPRDERRNHKGKSPKASWSRILGAAAHGPARVFRPDRMTACGIRSGR